MLRKSKNTQEILEVEGREEALSSGPQWDLDDPRSRCPAEKRKKWPLKH